MTVIKYILTIWVVLVHVGCSHRETPTNTPLALSSQSVPKDTVITLERTGCYRNCPRYKLMIFADGSVVFDGREYVKRRGVIRGTLNQEQLRRLVSIFDRKGFFTLKETYETVGVGCTRIAEDAGYTYTSIKINGKSKTVKRDNSCDDAVPSLVSLENEIDEVTNSQQWVK